LLWRPFAWVAFNPFQIGTFGEAVNERDMEISMTTHIALFRSLNVGGKNVIKMTALTALFAECGAVSARAYIQSGTILFESARAEAVLGGVSKALRDDHKMYLVEVAATSSARRG